MSSDLEVIARYLARRDLPSLDPAQVRGRFDVVVLCGSAVPDTVELAAQALHDGIAGQILVTGGVGHSTPFLRDAVSSHPLWHDVPTAARPEAAVIAEILRRHCGVPPDVIATEERATNCGENAALSLRLLPRTGRVLLVQDPTMQRRTHASFDHHQRLLGTALEVVSQAPVVLDADATWGRERFVTLLLGEVRRLTDDADGYGPRGAGFIDHVDVPDDVLTAAARVAQAFPNLRSRRA